jgi:mRNA interferase RelE/StbE
VTYRLDISPAAEKQMRRLPDNIFRSVDAHIKALQDDPRPRGSRKLAHAEGWRIRVGAYRVIYEIDDNRGAVNILAVKPRQSAYK